MNTNHCNGCRLGNSLFIGVAVHLIVKRSNLKFSYKYHDKLTKLGIELFSGEKTFDETVSLRDHNFMGFILGEEPLYKNIHIINNVWCQIKEFAIYLKNYFEKEEQKTKIINANPYKSRYENNNDVYVHVRLGDIAHRGFTPAFDYFDKALSGFEFENGYISSDTITHPLCKQIIEKFNLKTIETSEEDTVAFASTCKYLVLSSGTFSWMIGVFGYFSKIYYPKIYKVWHGDIFVFPEWNEIEYDYVPL